MKAYVEITANGSGDTISVIGGEFDGSRATGSTQAGAGDTITVAGQTCGGVEISSNGAALGADDTINVGDATIGHGDAYVIVGANSTVNIVGSSPSAVVNVENVATGARSTGGLRLYDHHWRDGSRSHPGHWKRRRLAQQLGGRVRLLGWLQVPGQRGDRDIAGERHRHRCEPGGGARSAVQRRHPFVGRQWRARTRRQDGVWPTGSNMAATPIS